MNYVEPHKIKSREVTKADLDRVLSDAVGMMELCIKPPEGRYAAYAIAHSQVTDSDPLRFFVTNQQMIIINPVITRHVKVPVDSFEQCTTYMKDKASGKVPRYHKCEVTFYTTNYGTDPELVEQHSPLSGLQSKIFQHEIDHMEGIYVYDYEGN